MYVLSRREGLSIQHLCLRNVFTSRREYLPSSLLSPLSRGTLVPSRTQRGWIRNGTREEGERDRRGRGVGRWKYHLSRPGLSISAALIR